MKLTGNILTIIMLASLLGCSLHQVQDEIDPPAFTPQSFSQSGEVTAPDRWWEAFNDVELNRLIDKTLVDNRDLRAAFSRLKQFYALAAPSGTMPQASAGLNAARARAFPGDEAVTGNDISLDISVSWEIDLYKRLSALDAAQALEADAFRQDTEALALSLSAAVARTWYGAAAQRQVLDLLQEQLDVNGKFLDIIETRFKNGESSAVSVYQQREQMAAIEAQIPPATALLKTLEHQLAVLTGEPPKSAIDESLKILPDLPAPPSTGLPSDLVRKRPDLRAAAIRITTADYRVGAALANRYPRLTLAGSTGYNAGEISDLFDNWIWNLIGGLAQPIFSAGEIAAEIDRTEAVLEEAVNLYEGALLNALLEVEDALTRETYQHQLLDRLQKQLDLAESALDSGQARYLEGVGDFLTVLTEIQATQRIQRSLIIEKNNLIGHRIALYQALGGDWTAALNP